MSKPNLISKESRIEFSHASKAVPFIGNSSQYDQTEGKYNSIGQKRFFAFANVDQEEIGEPPELDYVDDFEKKIKEPSAGMFELDFDETSYNQTRMSIPYVQFVPHRFTRKEPVLKNLEDFSPKETLTNIELLGNDTQSITMINISNAIIPSKMKKNLTKLINSYPLLEVLQARNIGLKKIGEFKNLARLKWCDLSHNQISDLKEVVKFFSRTVFMETIDLSDNPVCKKENWREKLIATDTNLTLRAINGRTIKPEERTRSILAYGTKQAKEDIHYIQWDSILCNLEPVKQMKIWNPEAITKIVATNLAIQLFHVGELTALKVLDLSDNRISNIRGMGLERMNNLTKISLKNNSISKKENLKTFSYIPSLRHVWLDGNKELGNYRLPLIGLTKHLLGDNRHPGLLSIDGKNITLEERLQAIHSLNKKADIHGTRWKMACIEYYGHFQLREKGYLSKIRHLRLPDKKLGVVNLQPFPNLHVLDLSYNNLPYVDGLQFLSKLQVLNLFGNPLVIEKVLPTLRNLTELTSLSLGHPNEKSKNYFKSVKYRQAVLKEVISQNRWLKWFDSVPITVQDRVEIFSLSTKDPKEVDEYRFRLAININCTAPDRRRWNYSEIEPGKRFDIKKTTKLHQLHSMGLTSNINFARFINLTEINLAGNKLKSIHNIGIEQLKLRILDVHDNQIDTAFKVLAPFLDTLTSLRVICLRGNPCMKDLKDRLNLIGQMKSMRNEKANLRIIDSEISIDERIEAWKKQGGKADESELLRWKTLLYQRIPEETEASHIKVLDLTNGGLLNLDVTAFEGLETLLLKNNRLKSVNHIRGLTELKKLRTLDLRKNLLEDMKEIASLVTGIPTLAAISLKNNKVGDAKNYRQNLIDRLPQLHEVPTNFRVIDNIPITVAEIMKGYKISGKASPDRVRFEVIRLLQLEGQAADLATELDCSNADLTLKDIDFTEYPRLEKLGLRGNNIKDKYLLSSNLHQCKTLKEIDLGSNQIKELKTLHKVIGELPQLEALWIDGNPLYNDKDGDIRAKVLSGLTQLDKLGAPFQKLNGLTVSIAEICRGLEIAKVFDKEGLEKFRTELIWDRWKPDEFKPKAINLRGNDLTSLAHIAPRIGQLATVRVIDLSKNRLSSLKELQGLLDKCFKLHAIDLRENNFPGTMKELLKVLKTCPGLLHIRIAKAFANKNEASEARNFINQAFSIMPQVETCDDYPNPTFPASKRTQKSKRIWDSLHATPEQQREHYLRLEEEKKKQESFSKQEKENGLTNSGAVQFDLLPNDDERPPSYGAVDAPPSYNPNMGASTSFPAFSPMPINPPSFNPSYGNDAPPSYNPNMGTSFPSHPLTPHFAPQLNPQIAPPVDHNPSGNYEFNAPLYNPSFDSFQPTFAPASAPSIATLRLNSSDLPSFDSPSFDIKGSGGGGDSLYPDLGFNTDNYLPKDYHGTIGRNVDLSELANKLKERADKEEDDDDDYTPWTGN